MTVTRRDDAGGAAGRSVVTIVAAGLADDSVEAQLSRFVFVRGEDGG